MLLYNNNCTLAISYCRTSIRIHYVCLHTIMSDRDMQVYLLVIIMFNIPIQVHICIHLHRIINVGFLLDH